MLISTGRLDLHQRRPVAVGLAGLLDYFKALPAMPGVLRVHFSPPLLVVAEGIVHDALMPRPIREPGAELAVGLLPGGDPDLHPAVMVGEAGVGAEGVKVAVHGVSSLRISFRIWRS